MRRIGHYLGNIAGLIIAFVLYIGVLQPFYFLPGRLKLGSYRVIITALVTVTVLIIISWLYHRQLQSYNDWDFDQPPHWDMRRMMVALAGFILIFLVSAIMLRLVGGGVSENQQNLDKIAAHAHGLFQIMVVFIAPFCEEIIFRGMFFNIFFTKETSRNKWLGIVTSGFLFGYMHDPMLSKYILVYWVLGIILAWVYLTTKDLRYSMLVHMCYNALGFI